jgi:drug/metabolite transporter (DMT)-like permease
MNTLQNQSTLKGVALVSAATLLFAVSDVTGKHLFETYSVMDVAAVRYAVNLALLLVLLYPKHGTGMWATKKTVPVILRGLCLVFATITMSVALRLMPVGETVAILYLSPFLVMLLAGPLLGERVTLVMWIGAAVGFSGVLLIARPGGGLDPLGVVLMLINAVLATTYILSTRILAKTESTIAMLFHSALSGFVIFGAWFLATLDDFQPTLYDIGLMALLGVLSTGGHFLFTAAYREAPSSLLAPVNYLHLVWAGVLGFLVFGHLPDAWSTAGMLAVVLSGSLTALVLHRIRVKTGQ